MIFGSDYDNDYQSLWMGFIFARYGLGRFNVICGDAMTHVLLLRYVVALNVMSFTVMAMRVDAMTYELLNVRCVIT
jgi:hypothetical protein